MFPVLDSLRPATGFGGAGQRHVQSERTITVRVDETDEYITVPLRSVFTDDGLTGASFEVGPYSLDREDAFSLLESLVSHLAASP